MALARIRKVPYVALAPGVELPANPVQTSFRDSELIQNWLMRLGAKFKLLNALTFAIHFTGLRFARVFYNFYSLTIQA